MDLLRLDGPLPTDLHDPVLVVALDGWTDAGEGGTRAARELVDQLDGTRLGELDPDALFDYRDRRPVLEIERGTLGEIQWPSLELHWVRPTVGPDLLVLSGAEPDLGWRAMCRSIASFALDNGVERSIGLGSVPGPIPHTRSSRLVVTSTEEQVFDRFGRPHEEMLVPASCQVALERELGHAGLHATGLWVRIPHYVATDYPEASQVLLQSFVALTGVELAVEHLDPEVEEQREKLDEAAEGSPEVQAHIRMLEDAYDQTVDDETVTGLDRGPIPTGDQIAAELERFLREEG
jgi:proteasome assembly chaperone (PAC2) family protein